jgi:hypothetical protein
MKKMNTMKIKNNFQASMSRRKMNTKGWIRIVEVFFAILLILATVLILNQRQIKPLDVSDIVYEKQRSILNVIVNNPTMRTEVITETLFSVDEFIQNNIPNNWDYAVDICGVEEICNQGVPVDREVYVSETIVTASYINFPNEESKKLRFFVWAKDNS